MTVLRQSGIAKSPSMSLHEENFGVRRPIDYGVTLVELLIVMAIIGVLFQMIFPAVEMSREAARNAQCKNNLRQIGIAMTDHHNTFGRLPSGGWMFRWIGEPERGTNVDQPGSWVFNLLSFIDETELRNMGLNMRGKDRQRAISARCGTPLPLFVCPSRRLATAYRVGKDQQFRLLTRGSRGFVPKKAARSDYAASVGEAIHLGMHGPIEYGKFPLTLKEGDNPAFPWNKDETYTGVCFRHSRITLTQVTDGTSYTYLVGEKYMDASRYKMGPTKGDNVNLYSAQGLDNYRTSSKEPFRDTEGVQHWKSFGSAHVNGFNMCFCDGSVRSVNFDIDPPTHRKLGSRSDGETITMNGDILE